MGLVQVMGLKNWAGQQLCEKTYGGEIKQTAYSLHLIILNLLNFYNKSFLKDFKTFLFIFTIMYVGCRIIIVLEDRSLQNYDN
jgi:hypothetical protein